MSQLKGCSAKCCLLFNAHYVLCHVTCMHAETHGRRLSRPVHVQVAYNPQVLLPASKLGENSEVFVQDAAALAQPGESLSFWQVQVMHTSCRSRCYMHTVPLSA